MSRLPLLTLLAASMLLPLTARAQMQNQTAPPYDGAYNYGQNFLFNQDEERKKAEEEEQSLKGVWQYDSKYKYQPPSNDDGNGKLVKLIPPGQQLIYLVRTEKNKPNEATLRMSTSVSVTGCLNMIPPIVTMRKGGDTLVFKIEDGEIALDKTIRYAHFQCNQGSNIATADITLNRDDIISDKIKKLSFTSSGRSMDIYDLELNGNTLSLHPKTSAAFKTFTGTSKADPLAYTFYPENTIILSAPSAPKDADISQELSNLAHTKGMVESTEGLKSANSNYFIDQSGALAGSLAYGANAYVGTINASQTFKGPEGTYQQEKQIDVYAKRPGLLD